MNNFLKLIPTSLILMFVSSFITQKAIDLKAKDTNDFGRDDAAGNFLLSLSPAILAVDGTNENSFRKIVQVVYTAAGNYLNAAATN